jgi:ribosomal protein S18 acetylase RimI-like enzyme
METIQIEILNHRDHALAECNHRIQMAAYAEEARLLQVSTFPPLQRTIADIEHSLDHFFGARLGEVLVGLVSISAPEEAGERQISSLVVLPEFQRRGIGGALVSAVISKFDNEPLVVTTGALNAPALALYAKFGFVEIRRRSVSEGLLALVDLRRP